MKRTLRKRSPAPLFRFVIGARKRAARDVTFFESTDAAGNLRIESSPPVQLQQVVSW